MPCTSYFARRYRFVNEAHCALDRLTPPAPRSTVRCRAKGAAMATTRAMLERRRSSRVFIRIPIQVFPNNFNGQPLDPPAEAIAVSRTGALLRTPFQPALGSRIQRLNGISQENQQI